MAGSATRSAIFPLAPAKQEAALTASSMPFSVPIDSPTSPTLSHLITLATLPSYIYMYVGRSIRLNHPSNTSLPRDARVCVCVADIQAVHRTFLIPPDPALVSRRQPSSAGHDDLQISHPILLPHLPPVPPITTTYVSAHCGPTAAAPTTPSVHVASVRRGGHGYGVGTIPVSVVAVRSSPWKSS